MHKKTNSAYTKWLPVLGFGFMLPLLTGCVGGQYHGISALNPYTRKQWSEDEKLGPTFHQQIADLRDLKRSAKSLAPEAQERTVTQMTELVRNDKNPLIRAAGVRVLGEIPTATALPGIQTAASDLDSLVRIAACEALGRRGDTDAVAALAGLANDDTDTDVRLAAVAALGSCTGQQTVQALSLALDDSNPAIQYRAVKSLKSSTGESLGDNVAVWRAYLHGEPSPVQPATSIAERLQRIFY